VLTYCRQEKAEQKPDYTQALRGHVSNS